MAKFLHAASPDSADMLYATGFHAPDPFFFLEQGGKKSVLLSDLEIDRGRREAAVDEVLSLSELAREIGGNPPGAVVAAWFLRRRRVRRVEVPAAFPLGTARVLEEVGIRVTPAKGHFWPQRQCKSVAEIRHLRQGARLAKAGILRGVEVLRAASIGRGGKLVWSGRTLTSERLRAEIDCAVLRAGGAVEGTIVAGGRQACDPHERGHGPLRAHTLIILDVFPRDPRTGFFGDLTRTVVRGQATDAQRKLWQTVVEGQQLAIRAIKPGVSGARVHQAVRDFFTTSGYPTELKNGRWTGFFHGTGHGLGMDLHEEPRFSATKFLPGQVFTVEPGLYYPSTGGARHEDMVEVVPGGCKTLSHLRVPLEL